MYNLKLSSFLISIVLLSGYLYSDIKDYIYPFYSSPSYSNYGSLGLIQNPTARFHSNGTLGVTWTHHEPYLRGSVMAYPFDWLEAAYQYTDSNNRLYSSNKKFSGSQSHKDKSFDVKIRLLKESTFIPQVALGIRDFGGTGLFGSEYFVINKFLSSNLDVSIGIGWGNLDGNKISNPFKKLSSRFDKRTSTIGEGGKVNIDDFFSGDAGYFGGLEYVFPNLKGLRLKVEYDGTNYRTEGQEPIDQESKLNYGFVYPWSKNFHTKLFFSRGNTLNFGFSYSLSLGSRNPLGQQKVKKKTLDNNEIIRRVTSKKPSNLNRAALLYLRQNEINLQKASINDDEYHVVFSHANYRSPALAAGRTISIIDQIAPDYIKNIKVSEVNAGIGQYSASISRDIFKRYKDEPAILDLYLDTSAFKFDEEAYQYKPTAKYPAIFNSTGPELISQIGGPDGFFFGDLKWTLDSEVLFSRNLSLISSVSYGLYDNMDDLKLPSDSVLPHVRTDIVQYLKQSRDFSIKRFQLNYYKQIAPSVFYKLAGGIFESMFGGYGGEILYRPYDKNYGIGFELWEAYQREYDQLTDFRDYRTVTGHLSLYYQEPRSNILFTLKGGRYLAKDSGFTFEFSRIFESGLRIGAFFSLTDISAEEFGEGSFDKGFYFFVPVDLFSPRYFKRNFGWGLRPLTRDGAQSLIYGYPLWGVTHTSNAHRFRRRLYEFND